MRLVEGRWFAIATWRWALKVVLVNQALARRFFGDKSPVERSSPSAATPWEIIGVVGDVRQGGLDAEPSRSGSSIFGN